MATIRSSGSKASPQGRLRSSAITRTRIRCPSDVSKTTGSDGSGTGGIPVAAFSQDFTVSAGTLGKMHAQKIVQVTRYAMKMGVPLVAFKDSGGARIQEGVDALSDYGRVFYQNV